MNGVANDVAQAVRLLLAGGVVALPTETVYGLAADAGNASAVERVFQIKGRPSDNPLIVHVADVGAARRVAGGWPVAAQQLADAFWPGPLTLVVPRGQGVCDAVTCGGPTVAVRVPRHPLTLDILRRLHGGGCLGLAMPSANRSERISPTIARHVRHDLGDDVDLVVDGGPCEVGLESVVVDVTGDVPCVLRPGTIGLSALQAVVPRVNAEPSRLTSRRSPGTRPRHYAPQTPCRVVTSSEVQHAPASVAVIGHSDQLAAHAFRLAPDPATYSRLLYAMLRKADTAGADELWLEEPPPGPAWQAVRDRITRAAAR